MHWVRQHRGGGTGYTALKLDMSKAYDRVEWDFLRGMMSKLGFSLQWINLVMRCVTLVSYSFIINGQGQGSLFPGRGLRQGDPLSPYLFVTCAQGLSEMLIDYECKRLFKGVSVASSCPLVSHLFFANDSLIFCRARIKECVELKQCLQSYAGTSGQFINYEKSALSFSPNTRVSIRDEICSLFGISQVDGHDMYLGLPIFSMWNKRF
ncbi:hypothetical protein UlMin_012179 [Ulmus minor]